jgi:hypothetical protein
LAQTPQKGFSVLKIVIFGNSYEGTSSENGGMIPDNHAVVGRLPYIQPHF